MGNPMEARFVSSSKGVEDTRHYLVGDIQDLKNQCGRQFNPEQEEYWELMRNRLDKFSEEDLEYVCKQYHLLGENGERIKKVAGDVLRKKWEKRLENKEDSKMKVEELADWLESIIR